MPAAKQTTKQTTKRTQERRGQGRPVAGENDVGRERLIAAAEKLLRELPPARVTITRIAQEAGVDPALVRYYFVNRTALLFAVADRVTHQGTSHKAWDTSALSAAPQAALIDHIRQVLKLTRSTPFMHRLMIDELANADDDESRARVRKMNLELVAFYRRVFKADAGKTMHSVNPLFLHLLVLGASDFFATAEPLISRVVPSHTNMDKLAAGFQAFLVDIVIGGLSKR
jgi:TetR/AcrR family transcriptional regulator